MVMIIIITLQGPTLNCRTDHSFRGGPVISTIKDCYDHDIDPSGLAHNEEVCLYLCPVGNFRYG